MYVPLTLGRSDRDLGEEDLRAYLKRIGGLGHFLSGSDHLAHLQQRHLLSIPYETFDQAAAIPARFDQPHLFAKLVEAGRGGSAGELNVLFAWLLGRFGFACSLHAASVAREELPGAGRAVLLLVEADGDRWLVDVGHAIAGVRPLLIGNDVETTGRGGRFRVVAVQGALRVTWSSDGSAWRRLAEVDVEPVPEIGLQGLLAGIDEEERRVARDRGAVVSIFTEDGRATISGSTLTAGPFDARRVAELDAARRDRFLEHLFGLDPAHLPRL